MRQRRDMTLNSISAIPSASSGRIQPTAVLGCVVKFQPPRYAPRLRRRKGLVQGRLAMGIEVVQTHPDHRHIGVGLVHQPAHLVGEVPGGAPLRYRPMPPPELVEGRPGDRRSGTGCGCPRAGTRSPPAWVAPAAPVSAAGRRTATGWRSRRITPLASGYRRDRRRGQARPPCGPRSRRSPRECTTASSATA